MVRIRTEVREQHQNTTRHNLFIAAAEEFARQGYDQANINTISLNAGLAKGTIYNYFPSKQALLFGLIEDVAQEHFEFMRTAILVSANPAGRMELFFQAGFDYVAGHINRARTMFNTVYSSNREQKEFCYRSYQPLFQFVAEEILTPGMRQGIFREAELMPAAILLMTIYLGTASQVDELGRPRLNPKQVAQLVLNGL